MNARLALMLCALSTFGCAEPQEPGTDAFGGVHPDACMDGTEGTHHGDCEGLGFDLHVPPECLTQACGLILDVHGATMTGQTQEAHTSLGALAYGRGYLVLQPWAPGTPSQWSESLDANVLALTTRAMEVFSVDARRVHITGFSQGGFMTWRMLCKRPDLFASFAPLAATALSVLRQADQGEHCAEAGNSLLAPRPVFYAHGTADAVVAFTGALDSIETLRAAWSLSEEQSIEAGEHYDVVRYVGANKGVIDFMRHDFRTTYADEIFNTWEGHCFPGSHAPIGCGAGPAWGEAVLNFFESNPRR